MLDSPVPALTSGALLQDWAPRLSTGHSCHSKGHSAILQLHVSIPNIPDKQSFGPVKSHDLCFWEPRNTGIMAGREWPSEVRPRASDCPTCHRRQKRPCLHLRHKRCRRLRAGRMGSRRRRQEVRQQAQYPSCCYPLPCSAGRPRSCRCCCWCCCWCCFCFCFYFCCCAERLWRPWMELHGTLQCRVTCCRVRSFF